MKGSTWYQEYIFLYWKGGGWELVTREYLGFPFLEAVQLRSLVKIYMEFPGLRAA